MWVRGTAEQKRSPTLCVLGQDFLCTWTKKEQMFFILDLPQIVAEQKRSLTLRVLGQDFLCTWTKKEQMFFILDLPQIVTSTKPLSVWHALSPKLNFNSFEK
jgi:hypothetical protein